MFTTRQVLTALRHANPGTVVSEDLIRHAIRRGIVTPPHTFGGRFAWTDTDVATLAAALDLRSPGLRDAAARGCAKLGALA